MTYTLAHLRADIETQNVDSIACNAAHIRQLAVTRPGLLTEAAMAAAQHRQPHTLAALLDYFPSITESKDSAARIAEYAYDLGSLDCFAECLRHDAYPFVVQHSRFAQERHDAFFDPVSVDKRFQFFFSLLKVLHEVFPFSYILLSASHTSAGIRRIQEDPKALVPLFDALRDLHDRATATISADLADVAMPLAQIVGWPLYLFSCYVVFDVSAADDLVWRQMLQFSAAHLKRLRDVIGDGDGDCDGDGALQTALCLFHDAVDTSMTFFANLCNDKVHPHMHTYCNDARLSRPHARHVQSTDETVALQKLPVDYQNFKEGARRFLYALHALRTVLTHVTRAAAVAEAVSSEDQSVAVVKGLFADTFVQQHDLNLAGLRFYAMNIELWIAHAKDTFQRQGHVYSEAALIDVQAAHLVTALGPHVFALHGALLANYKYNYRHMREFTPEQRGQMYSTELFSLSMLLKLTHAACRQTGGLHPPVTPASDTSTGGLEAWLTDPERAAFLAKDDGAMFVCFMLGLLECVADMATVTKRPGDTLPIVYIPLFDGKLLKRLIDLLVIVAESESDDAAPSVLYTRWLFHLHDWLVSGKEIIVETLFRRAVVVTLSERSGCKDPLYCHCGTGAPEQCKEIQHFSTLLFGIQRLCGDGGSEYHPMLRDRISSSTAGRTVVVDMAHIHEVINEQIVPALFAIANATTVSARFEYSLMEYLNHQSTTAAAEMSHLDQSILVDMWSSALDDLRSRAAAVTDPDAEEAVQLGKSVTNLMTLSETIFGSEVLLDGASIAIIEGEMIDLWRFLLFRVTTHHGGSEACLKLRMHFFARLVNDFTPAPAAAHFSSIWRRAIAIDRRKLVLRLLRKVIRKFGSAFFFESIGSASIDNFVTFVTQVGEWDTKTTLLLLREIMLREDTREDRGETSGGRGCTPVLIDYLRVQGGDHDPYPLLRLCDRVVRDSRIAAQVIATFRLDVSTRVKGAQHSQKWRAAFQKVAETCCGVDDDTDFALILLLEARRRVEGETTTPGLRSPHGGIGGMCPPRLDILTPLREGIESGFPSAACANDRFLFARFVETWSEWARDDAEQLTERPEIDAKQLAVEVERMTRAPVVSKYAPRDVIVPEELRGSPELRGSQGKYALKLLLSHILPLWRGPAAALHRIIFEGIESVLPGVSARLRFMRSLFAPSPVPVELEPNPSISTAYRAPFDDPTVVGDTAMTQLQHEWCVYEHLLRGRVSMRSYAHRPMYPQFVSQVVYSPFFRREWAWLMHAAPVLGSRRGLSTTQTDVVRQLETAVLLKDFEDPTSLLNRVLLMFFWADEHPRLRPTVRKAIAKLRGLDALWFEFLIVARRLSGTPQINAPITVSYETVRLEFLKPERRLFNIDATPDELQSFELDA